MFCRASQNGTHHKANLKEIGRYAHENVDLAKEVKVEGGHAVIVRDAGEEIHQNELTIPLSSVARLLVSGSLGFSPAFYDNDSWCTAASHS